MPKQAWTVVATYDEDGEPFHAVVEAKDAIDARAKAKQRADSIIIGIQVFEGRIKPVDLGNLNDVTPIRGRGHEIEVHLVRVARRKVLIPSRCPKCKKDLTRARAIVETYLTESHWAMHLTHDGKSIEPDRDGGARGGGDVNIERVHLACSSCRRPIWEGKHVEA